MSDAEIVAPEGRAPETTLIPAPASIAQENHEAADGLDHEANESPNAEGANSSPTDDEVRKKFEELSAKEREILEKEGVLRDRELQVGTQREMVQRAIRAQELVRDGRHYEAARELGLDYEALTRAMLNEGKPDPTEATAKELEELKQWRQQLEAEREQQKALAEITEIVNSADDLKAIKALKRENAVFQIAKQNKVSFKEAAKQVQDWLTADVQALVDSGLVQWANSAEPIAVEQTISGKEQKEPRTLTNNLSSAPNREHTPLTEDERIARFAELIQAVK